VVHTDIPDPAQGPSILTSEPLPGNGPGGLGDPSFAEHPASPFFGPSAPDSATAGGGPATPPSLRTRLKRYRDALWQIEPPRLLRYRVSHLHNYAWMPFLAIHNLRATVFANLYLNLQGLLLLLWMMLIHTTG
jgi:hypothetical protein